MEEFKRIELNKSGNEERIKELLDALAENDEEKAEMSVNSQYRSGKELAESELGKSNESRRIEIIEELRKLGHEI